MPASPTITTTPSASTVTLGTSSVTLNDTATLSGGYYETGTITFTLYQGSTLVDTETVSSQWQRQLHDADRLRAADDGHGNWYLPVGRQLQRRREQQHGQRDQQPGRASVVNPASPTITTTPSAGTVTLGTSSVTLNDTATLSGGYYESGTITFTLYQGSTLVDTETVPVNGNGTYTTPTGYALPTTGTVTGTYQWDASYSGDGNNNTASETNSPAEQTVVNPASPTISTTSSAGTVTLGTSSVTLNDTATLSGGYYESGQITFTLYQGSTLVNTETIAVNGNGTYTTPTGYTLPTTGTVTGTYQWDASYSGDTNNDTANETNSTAEQTVVNPASPTITTTPSTGTVTLGSSLVTLNDTATLSGGYHETGTITFTLYEGSTLVNTETDSVNGNGTYTTPTGYTLPTTGSVTGTYQWDSSYSADTNNNPASENNNAAEQTVVNVAVPAITTTPSASAVTLGTSSVTLNDAATLSGGYYETGTITFTLYQGSTLVNTQTVSVNGNSTYTTPAGYTLPTTGTVTGTYQWDSTYSGSTNNASVSETNVPAEQTLVSPASPTITTVPGSTVSAGGFSISGTVDVDQTGCGFSSNQTPESGVTVDLYEESNGTAGLQSGSGGDTLVATTTTASNGTFTFSLSAAGTYYVAETVPAGYVQTGGGPDGTAGNSYYTIVASSGQTYSGSNFDNYLVPTCTPTNVSYTVTTPNNCSTTVASLAGNTQQGDTVTATFTVGSGQSDQLSLVSYTAPSCTFSDAMLLGRSLGGGGAVMMPGLQPQPQVGR